MNEVTFGARVTAGSRGSILCRLSFFSCPQAFRMAPGAQGLQVLCYFGMHTLALLLLSPLLVPFWLTKTDII